MMFLGIPGPQGMIGDVGYVGQNGDDGLPGIPGIILIKISYKSKSGNKLSILRQKLW
jgi:hypothetical protein